jgi:hypothetical protein
VWCGHFSRFETVYTLRAAAKNLEILIVSRFHQRERRNKLC